MSEIKDEIRAHLKHSEQSGRIGLHGQALEHLESAERLLEQMPLEEEHLAMEFRVKVLNNRGIIFKNLENFEESEECFIKAVGIVDEAVDINPKLPVGVYLNLANLKSRKRQYNPALENFNKALEAAEKLGAREAADIKCKIHNNLALFHCNFGERDKAQEELDRCLEYKGGDDFHIDFERERQAWVRTNLGLIHSELADEKELSDDSTPVTFRRAAIGFFREALEIYKAIDYRLMEARTLLNIATVERRLGMQKEAVEHLNTAVEIADRLRSDRLTCMVLEHCVNFHLSQPTTQFAGALDELFTLLAKTREPSTERILRRIEDRARRAGRREVLSKIRQKLRSETNYQKRQGGG